MIGEVLLTIGLVLLGLVCFAALGVCLTFCVLVIMRMTVNIVENWDRLRQRFAS